MPLALLPVPTKTWNQLGNAIVVPEASGTLQAAQTFVTIKNYLVALSAPGITIAGSSDAVTAGMDAVDRLTNKTKIISSSGSNRSWIVFTQTATGSQICLEWNSTAAYYFTGKMSASGAFTGGSVTAAPTATDSVTFKTTSTSWIADNNVGRFNVVVTHSADGTNTVISVVCASVLVSLAFFGSAANVVTGWTIPTISFWQGSTSLLNTQLHTPSFYTQNNTRVVGRSQTPAANMNFYSTLEGCQGSTIVEMMATNNSVYTSGAPLCLPGLYCVDSPTRGRHGTYCDLWFGTTHIPLGNIGADPITPSRQVMHLGMVAIPWVLNAALAT